MALVAIILSMLSFLYFSAMIEAFMPTYSHLGLVRGPRKTSQATRGNSIHLKQKLVVWDCDGVLVDSEALLKQGEVEALAKAGITVTVDDCVRMFSGVSPDTATQRFLEEMKVPLPANFFKEQIAGSMDLFRRRLQPLMANTVQTLHSLGVPMCVASGSPLNRVELCLEVANMKPCFPQGTVFTRELVARGKPAPDLFLYAAEKMGYQPQDCIVIEDAVSGIEAAKAAQMPVIAYLGGGHTKASWYRDAIYKYKLDTYEHEDDVLKAILIYIES
jgi:HAD superfamily hydrolase (TIGR01509 family)